jgi:predicted Zn-dependent protease
MSESSAPTWVRLELEPGMASYLGLPRKLYLPLPPDAPAPGEPGFSVATLGAGLAEAVEKSPEMAGHPDILRFVSRWTRLADMERYLRIGNTTFAERIARDLLGGDPGDPPASAALGHIAQTQGRWEEARNHYARVLERAPSHAQTVLEHALCTAADGNPGEALRRLKPLLDHATLQRTARLWSFEIRSGRKGIGERIRAFRAFGIRGETEQETIVDVVRRLFPDNPETAYTEALDLPPPERAARLHDVLNAAPGHVPARIALAETHRTGGRPGEARRVLQEGLRRFPDRADLHAHLGAAEEAAGRTEAARAAYRRVFENPLAHLSPAVLRLGAAGMLRVAGPDETRLVLEDTIAARPGDVLPHRFLARLDEREHGPDRAERRLREAIKACGPHPELQYALGDLLRRTGRRTEAEGTFRVLARRHRRDPWGHRGLGDLAVHDDPSAAAEHYARAHALDPATSIPGYDYLQGLLALGRGAFSDAVAFLGRAVSGEPDNAVYWSQLGAALFYEERLDAAVRAAERADALHPGHPGYLHNLATFHRARFGRRPIRRAGSLLLAWRYRARSRRAERASGSGWERSLWKGPPASGDPTEEPGAKG